jgi:hypothetical protein
LSTRHYPAGLEPVGARTEQAAVATSRSAVSRRLVAATETALAQLLAADLSLLDLVATSETDQVSEPEDMEVPVGREGVARPGTSCRHWSPATSSP